ESRLIEDYVLTATAESVEIRVIVDWREHARMLKLRYSTALGSPVAAYEIPYGALERPASGEEEPGQRWADVSGSRAERTRATGRAATSRLSLPTIGRDLEVEIGPFEIGTFRIPRDRAAASFEVDLLERPVDAA